MSDPTCPIPKPSSVLVTSAAREVPCGSPATVMAEVPMKAPNGNQFLQRMMVCLAHSINLTVWKLCMEIPAEAADPPRILCA